MSEGQNQEQMSEILPDTDILFPPYNSFIREMVNNSMQLRQLMKPRYQMMTAEEPVKNQCDTLVKKLATKMMTAEEPGKKKCDTLVKQPATLVKKKPATLVRKKPATLVTT